LSRESEHAQECEQATNKWTGNGHEHTSQEPELRLSPQSCRIVESGNAECAARGDVKVKPSGTGER
jgi:hypothetical protein